MSQGRLVSDYCGQTKLLRCIHITLMWRGTTSAHVVMHGVNIFLYIFNRNVCIGLTWRWKAWADALWCSTPYDVSDTNKNSHIFVRCVKVCEESAVKVFCTFRCVVHTVNMEEELIEHVWCRLLLYDPSDQEYRNQNVWKEAWDEIGENFEISSQYKLIIMIIFNNL
jgi:hypothetical protein